MADWNVPVETTREQDRANLALAPAHIRAEIEERLRMTDEERKLDYQRRAAEADAKRAAEVGSMTDKVIEQRRIEERIAEKAVEKEQVRQGAQTKLPPQADPNSIKLKVARRNEVTTEVKKPLFLYEPYLLADSVVGFYGKGGSGKSSLLATLAAEISPFASTLWISTEEDQEDVRDRGMMGIPSVNDNGVPYMAADGQDETLQVFQAVVTKTDKDGRAVESMFNVYEHLEPAIIMANTNVMNLSHQKPVKLVVLDTIVALTTWDRQAGPNSDEGVKRLMAFLRSVAERRNVTIAVVGHANKGKHDHFADSVMGAVAWTTSPRLSFMHAKDRTTDGQIIVRLAKSNKVPEFAELFSLHMVLQQAQIADGPAAGLFKVKPLSRVWGPLKAEELWDEVTTPPREEGDGEFAPKRETVVNAALQFIVDQFANHNATEVTRQEVDDHLRQKTGKNIDNHRWLKVDAFFVNHPTLEKAYDHTRRNLVVYRRRT